MPNLKSLKQLAKIAEKLAPVAKKTELPMDLESRMARAKEMGFDTKNTYYHGTPARDFSEFKPSSFFTPDFNFASSYSQAQNLEPNARILPVYLKKQNIFDFENPEHLDKLKPFLEKMPFDNQRLGLAERQLIPPKNTSERANNIIKSLANKESNWLLLENKDINKAIQNAGFDGTFIKEADRKNVMMFDPKNIRSKFATFDPSKVDSTDISAGLGAIGLGGLAAKNSSSIEDESKEDRFNRIMNLLNKK